MHIEGYVRVRLDYVCLHLCGPTYMVDADLRVSLTHCTIIDFQPVLTHM